eukprot:1154237-Pelagomonas_calceolata.AAC.16
MGKQLTVSSGSFSKLLFMILTCCVMALFATSFSSTPPMKMWTVRGPTNWEAMAFTSFGQVALCTGRNRKCQLRNERSSRLMPF